MSQRFDVQVGEQHAGVLSTDDELIWRFAPSTTWLARPDRRVLAHAWEGRQEVVSHGIPAWFAHLLPEADGALRELLSKALHLDQGDDEGFLERLGGDLPGNVRVGGRAAALAVQPEGAAERLRFALAGVQLKFSVVRDGHLSALPVRGRDGDWIAKLASRSFPRLPEIEAATMAWARASGLDVADTELVTGTGIDGVDATLTRGGPMLLVRRFDRPTPGQRRHFEDFGQLLQRPPKDKYLGSFDDIAVLTWALGGQADLEEWVRRMVFVIASGNGDAHLKNWAVLYDDAGQRARIAPAYDQVSTIQYPHLERHLQLTLGGSRRFQDCTPTSFAGIATATGSSGATIESLVATAVEQVWSAWVSGRDGFGYTAKEGRRLANHLGDVPLFRGR